VLTLSRNENECEPLVDVSGAAPGCALQLHPADRGRVENKQPTELQSPLASPHPSRGCVSIHPTGKSREHIQSLFKCYFSMTLLRGFYCYVTSPGPDGACAAALAGVSLKSSARPMFNLDLLPRAPVCAFTLDVKSCSASNLKVKSRSDIGSCVCSERPCWVPSAEFPGAAWRPCNPLHEALKPTRGGQPMFGGDHATYCPSARPAIQRLLHPSFLDLNWRLVCSEHYLPIGTFMVKVDAWQLLSLMVDGSIYRTRYISHDATSDEHPRSKQSL